MSRKCEKCGGSVEDTQIRLLMGPAIKVYCCRQCNEVYHWPGQDFNDYREEDFRCENIKHNYWKEIEELKKTLEDYKIAREKTDVVSQ